jgi:uncharacterized protein (TIGR03437 family)
VKSLLLALVFIGLVSIPRSFAQSPDILLEPVLSGLSSPVFAGNAHDGSKRLFVVEQTGKIKVLRPGSTSPTTFLDLSANIACCGERGLLGLAFHPQYSVNGRFFVDYTRKSDGATVISEFQVSAGNADVAQTTEKILLTISQPFQNHNGGMVVFGPDGYLYIGMGDGGSANDPGNRAQNTQVLLGKILRIDVDHPNGTEPYSSPSTNPFFGAAAGADEIYAFGMRNPWRFSFDRQTGQLYVGDVGQNDREEVDIVTLGGNYGWRVMEGTECTGLGPASCNEGNFIPPIIDYGHSGGRCSITGGYVYRGSGGTFQPGQYLFGDYCSGEIFSLTQGAMALVKSSGLQVSSFGEDETGELYVVGLGGTVYRLTRVIAESAATYRGSPLAVESLAVAFGSNLTTGAGTGTTLVILDSTGKHTPAPLLFVSPGQINFQVPAGVALGPGTATITGAGGTVSTASIDLASVAPGIFAANRNGQGVATAVALRLKPGGEMQYEQLTQFDPGRGMYVPLPLDFGAASDQVFLVLFGTGMRFGSGLGGVSATIGGTSAEVTFIGAQGTFVGLDQVNLRLPRSLAGRGQVDVRLTVDGFAANTVNIAFK